MQRVTSFLNSRSPILVFYIAVNFSLTAVEAAHSKQQNTAVVHLSSTDSSSTSSQIHGQQKLKAILEHQSNRKGLENKLPKTSIGFRTIQYSYTSRTLCRTAGVHRICHSCKSKLSPYKPKNQHLKSPPSYFLFASIILWMRPCTTPYSLTPLCACSTCCVHTVTIPLALTKVSSICCKIRAVHCKQIRQASSPGNACIAYCQLYISLCT